MRNVVAGIVAAIIVVSSIAIVTGQETEPEYAPPAEGLRASVGRNFVTASNTASDLVWLEVRIAEFSDDQAASTAITPWFEQVRQTDGPYTNFDYDLTTLRPVAIETIADETRALLDTVALRDAASTGEREAREVAVLAVREQNRLYTFISWARYGSLLDETEEIAKRTLGVEPLEFAPVPDVPYETGGLWDMAPRIEHLPQGFTWYQDYLPCVGVFGVNPCPIDATPAATPVATPRQLVVYSIEGALCHLGTGCAKVNVHGR